jgi:phosphatidylglycerol:prolipoprotein diacylglycerol transferase
MYPNLYYVLKDWFNVEWKKLEFLNTFGLLVAISFVIAAMVLNSELKRKEKQGLLTPREETIEVGKPASFFELLVNGLFGFLFGYKLIGLLFSKPVQIPAQEYIFSASGSILGGIIAAAVLVGVKWREKDKQRLKEPERRSVRIWPHDRVGDIIILGLIFGIVGAKLFDNLENWDEFIKDPVGRLFSASGLTFYGGLIMASAAICWYAYKKGIKLTHLVDAAAPALMIAYAMGRIGCQLSGDGDWGIYNSAYVSDGVKSFKEANAGDFDQHIKANTTYYLTEGTGILKPDSTIVVKHAYFKAPSFLPKWMVAYTYPQNVNKNGVPIPGCTDEHCNVLPQPVFPTPFYETIMCSLLFLLLWSIRKKIKTPGVIFGIYLILNGTERFFIEKIRVNTTYSIVGFHPTQAEIISSFLVIIGLIFLIKFKKADKI